MGQLTHCPQIVKCRGHAFYLRFLEFLVNIVDFQKAIWESKRKVVGIPSLTEVAEEKST